MKRYEYVYVLLPLVLANLELQYLHLPTYQQLAIDSCHLSVAIRVSQNINRLVRCHLLIPFVTLSSSFYVVASTLPKSGNPKPKHGKTTRYNNKSNNN